MPEKLSSSGAESAENPKVERRITVLRDMQVFTGLRDPQLATLADDLHVREYEKDETIFRQGDESKQIYFVLRGKVRIFKISPSGVETSIDIFTTNDVIGELAALDSQPRSASAKAITRTSLLTMAQERFVYHLETMPGLALSLCRVLSQKLRWTSAYAESIAQFDAAGRLLHIILLDRERYGRRGPDGSSWIVELGLNQTDLASMIGARREWVNRILNDWKRRGLLEFENGTIVIPDLPRVVAERDSRLEANNLTESW